MLKVAVIGVGNMGKNHARVYSELNNCDLVAISDLDEEKGKALSERYKCRFYKDYKEMLNNEKIDAVSIAVPTKQHKDVALDVINRKIHLLLEKPIADNIENAERIVDAAKENNVKLFVGHIERFNPAISKLAQIIKEDRLGKITSIVATRVGGLPTQIKDANVVIDLAVHDIDIINYLIGKDPIEIHANGGEALIDSMEDYAEIFLKYGDASGFIIVNWITPIKIRRLNVTGTKGYAELDYLTQKLVVYESNYEKSYDDFGDFIVKFGTPNKVEMGIDTKEPLKEEVLEFLECIEKDKEPACNGIIALNALKIALKAIKDIKK